MHHGDEAAIGDDLSMTIHSTTIHSVTTYSMTTMESQPLAWYCAACDKMMNGTTGTSTSCPECGSSFRWMDGVWRAAPGFSPSGFSADRRDHLQELETDHFWFPPRGDLLRSKALEWLPGEGGRLLDLGCGTGSFLASFASDAKGTPILRVGVEGHLESLERARIRSTEAVWVHADVTKLPIQGEQFDVVTSFDVLEHVEPRPLLDEALRLTRPGGVLLLSVPAFQSLWSAHDAAAGHRLRYRLAGLVQDLEAAGWRLEGHTYYQCLLFPLVWASRALRADRRGSVSSAPHIERRPPTWLGRMLLAVNRFEVRVFEGRTLPFGSSLIAWARKPL
jgi:SAM-dependent methyltransferase